jgi:hypothetical protein
VGKAKTGLSRRRVAPEFADEGGPVAPEFADEGGPVAPEFADEGGPVAPEFADEGGSPELVGVAKADL